MSAQPALRTLIIDDEPLAIERLQVLCAAIATIRLVGTAADGKAALRLTETLAPDLLLLDIGMPGFDGLEVARILEERVPKPAVIFVTAFDQFAVAAFDVSAIDYLLKPVAPERLERAVARVHSQIRSQAASRSGAKPWTQEFWVPHRGEIIRVAASDIDLIEAERDYMRLHIGPRSYLLHRTIGELERMLDPAEFIRLHRSTIARRRHIVGFKYDGGGGWLADLRDGKTIRIGRSYLANARAMAGR
ncbi:MAG TPA: LytTR family DNA-binding domain-containing protein [Alphaproteobacteria bacterium]|nr:LytTR family DNA-binding domain-containing protein [Alphaproteobacteria bacterium]